MPQLLLVQPEQLNYDLAFALALLPLLVAGIVFFLQDAVLLFAIGLLAGIVCLLAVQLARLTFGLPAWVGFKATHPLVASLLITCFCSPRTPAWVAAAMVILFVIADTVIWPQLQRVMLHPALLVFGLLFIIERQLQVGYSNAFDGRLLPEPLILWFHFGGSIIDPVKLYVGNVPGPIGVTSAGAVLLGVTYLWYTRKISLGVVTGFLAGVAAVAIAMRSDLGFQLASGPSLYVAGYIAADRRRELLTEQFTFLFGLAAGAATMLLRWYGEGLQSSWQGLLLASVVVTVVLRVRGFLGSRSAGSGRRMRTLDVDSRRHEPRAVLAPVHSDVRQPVMAAARQSTGYGRASVAPSSRGFDTQQNQNDLVRQMRIAATRSNSVPGTAVLLASLLLLNPLGLWLTWKTQTMARQTRLMLTAASVLWYLAVAGLLFARLHR